MRDSWVLRRLAPTALAIAVAVSGFGVWARTHAPASDRQDIYEVNAEFGGDLNRAVRYLAAAHTHGETHNYASMQERVDLLATGRLDSFCAEVVRPALVVLRAEGHDARHAMLTAVEPDRDGVYQQHHVIEAFDAQLDEWVVVDIDYGQRLNQPASTLTGRRGEPVPLEPRARDIEAVDAYPMVDGAVSIIDPDTGARWFDGARHDEHEIDVLASLGWTPFEGDFDARFYGSA